MTSLQDLLTPSGGQEQSVPALQPAAKKQPYRAFEVSSQEKRYLEIRVKYPEPAECPSNAMLSNIRAEWRMGQAITLGYGQTREGLQIVVEIRGENLTELYRALKEWKVEWIAEFNAEDYAPPTDEAAPFIKSIAIHTKRPEQPPPVDKRH
jgi:hypothetical protein